MSMLPEANPKPTPAGCIPKPDLEVLMQLIDDERGIYRMRTGKSVRYLEIAGDFFDEDTMCRPYLMIPSLPELPDTEWTDAHIRRDPDGQPVVHLFNSPRPTTRNQCSSRLENVLDFSPVKRYKKNVYEVLLDGKPAVAKIAHFAYELPNMEMEIDAYAILSKDVRPGETPVCAEVLAHLTENGRIIGILLEKLDGDHAGTGDLQACTDVVRRIHRSGIIHGDVNRYNFLIDRASGSARMVDFEHMEEYEDEVGALELEVLPYELAEETGRGGPGRIIKAAEQDISETINTTAAASAG